MRITLQNCYVLHTRAYRETSALLELFSELHGRVTVVARGVRRQHSQLRGLLQPFIPLLITWQGRGELMTLVAAEAQPPPLNLSGENLLSGFYLNELLMRLLHRHDPHPALYSAYQNTLLALQQKNTLQKTLRLFEKQLLAEIGYGLSLQRDAESAAPIVADQQYIFCPERGFVSCDQKAHSSAYIFCGKSLLALASGELEDSQSLQDAKRLMRLVLTPLLGNKALMSREIFFKKAQEGESNE